MTVTCHARAHIVCSDVDGVVVVIGSGGGRDVELGQRVRRAVPGGARALPQHPPQHRQSGRPASRDTGRRRRRWRWRASQPARRRHAYAAADIHASSRRSVDDSSESLTRRRADRVSEQLTQDCVILPVCYVTCLARCAATRRLPA